MKTFIVDAFTDTPFKGNPAGVCITDSQLSDDLMLNIAQELNYSETAFVRRLDGCGTFSIRFFSPKMEIPLCGHATLASAKAVFACMGISDARFQTSRGATLDVRSCDDRIEMVFPVYETEPAQAPPQLLTALGLMSVLNTRYNGETQILLLETGSVRELAELNPDFAALYHSHSGINGVLVTAASNDYYDFHSRYFWPWSGTNEDPVTGGVQTFLAKYWSGRLGKTRMRSFQSSKRTGSMDVELLDGKVLISAKAAIVFEGELHLRMNGIVSLASRGKSD
jgi:PhzF family phenazine biosynthesis protein